MKDLVLAFALASCLVAGAARAADEEEEPRFGIIPEGSVFVQLMSFGAPVRQPSGRVANMPVTVVLKVPKHEYVGYVCKLSARIRDGMLQSLFAQPIPLNRSGTPDFTGVGDRLVEATNRVLRARLVEDARVYGGAKPLGGGAMSKLPFQSVLGCKGLGGE